MLDDFSDGNFNKNPEWIGDEGLFRVFEGQLRSNVDPSSSITYNLSLTSSVVYEASWEFVMTLDFPTSGANYVDVYLMSDAHDLKKALNGYFIRIGDRSDDISLYKLSNGIQAKLIEDSISRVGASRNNSFKIRLTRDADSWFSLTVDEGRQGSFQAIGSAQDEEHQSSVAFGFLIQQSTANAAVNGHFFDEIKIGGSSFPDRQSPRILKAIAEGPQSILLTFDELVAAESAQQLENYIISPAVNIVAIQHEEIDLSKIRLALDQELVNGKSYNVQVSGIEDVAGNSLLDTTVSFQHIIYSTPEYRDIVINELHPDPGSNALPSQEYVEVFNTSSDDYFQMQSITISDEGRGTATLSEFDLGPGQYLLLSRDTLGFENSSSKMVLSLPSLNNSGDKIYLARPDGEVLDSLIYNNSGDYAIEQINPFIDFFLTENYAFSTSNLGGTPGLPNSVYDTVLDSRPPVITVVEVLTDQSLRLEVDEKLERPRAELPTNFTIDSNSVREVILSSDSKSIELLFTSQFVSGKNNILEIKGLADLFGNQADSVVTFSYYKLESPRWGDVRINEFMVSPNESEFVELLNVSNKYFDLEGWQVLDQGGNIILLPNYRLDPGSFVVINSKQGIDSIAVNGFPILNNSADGITLLGPSKQNVDVVSYQIFDEGRSYELINPTLACRGIYNYAMSKTGHTAGVQNSQFTNSLDQISPQVHSVEVHSPDSLTISFSEPIDNSSLLLSHLIVGAELIKRIDSVSDLTIAVMLTRQLPSETFYSLRITNLADCSGNMIADTTVQFYADFKPPVLDKIQLVAPDELHLIFDEPLEPLSSADRVKFLISELQVKQVNAIVGQPNELRLVFESEMQLGGHYNLMVTGLSDTSSNPIVSYERGFLFESSIISYRIIASHVIELLFDTALENCIEQKHFLFQLEGMPIPRTVELLASGKELRLIWEKEIPDNDSVRLYVGPLDDRNGSQVKTPAIIIFRDTKPPKLTGATVLTATSILLNFDEELAPSSAVNPINYLVDDLIPYEVLMVNNQTVRLVAFDSLPSEEPFDVIFRRIRDVLGNQESGNKRVELVYDILAPKIDSAFQIRANQVEFVAHESLDTSSIEAINVLFEGGSGQEIAAVRASIVQDKLRAEWDRKLPPLELLKLSLSGWSDLFGNIEEDTITYFINTLNLRLSAIQPESKDSIILRFSHPIDTSNVAVENILLDDQPADELYYKKADELGVVFNVEMEDEVTYELTLKSVFNLAREVVVDSISAFIFNSFFDRAVIHNANSIALVFEKELDRDQYFRIVVDGQSPSFFAVNQENSFQIDIFLNDSLSENRPTDIAWSTLTAIDGTTLPAFGDVIIFDTKPPNITMIESLYLGEIRIEFSEPVQFQVVQLENQLEILGTGNADYIQRQSGEVFTAIFEDLERGGSYQLVIKNISDLQGNFLKADTMEFTYTPAPLPTFGQLLINELMINPSPPGGLPEAEYIEIFNYSSDTVSLGGLMVTDRTKSSRLPNHSLAPYGYIVLTEKASDFGFLEIEEWVTLDNGSDSISLLTFEGELIDAVYYHQSWYGDTREVDGGFSLERINPSASCSGASNWSVSTNPSGGTPGEVNSIYSTLPDGTSPKVISASVLNERTLLVTFSEQMDTSVIDFGFVSMSTDVLKTEFQGLTSVMIYLDDALILGKLHSLQLSGFMDCSGNQLENIVLEVGIPIVPSIGDLVFSEIMMDSSPIKGLPDSEYLEISNRTDSILDLSFVTINDRQLKGHLRPRSLLILCPMSAIEFFDDLEAQAVSPWINLPNEEGKLRLMQGEELLQQLTYRKEWHIDVINREGGISLEAIDPDLYCGASENWQSSTSSSGGSPGVINSVNQEVLDLEAPEWIRAVALDSFNIQVDFSEQVIFSATDWLVDGRRVVQEITNKDKVELTVRLGLKLAIVPNRDYLLSVINLSDCYQNKAPTLTKKILLPEPSIPTIYVNEILFDPKPGGVDFIEIYNGSDSRYVDLQYMTLSNERTSVSITDNQTILFPNSYLVVTEDVDRFLFDFPHTTSEAIFAVDRLPSMPNDEGSLVLRDSSGMQLDSIYYNSDYHSSLLGDTEGVSLERLSTQFAATDANNWASAASISKFGTPGLPNSQRVFERTQSSLISVEPRTFIPGSVRSNTQNFTTISYELQAIGKYANIFILDARGQLIKTIGQGVYLGRKGFLKWDGTSDQGSIVRIGQYLIVFEMYGGSNPEKLVRREPVTIATDF
ncbi:MAG: hypothetical protein ACJAZM_000141 [Cyclobacteriaceae bacterium]